MKLWCIWFIPEPVHSGIYLKPDWNKSHQLSRRLAPLGILGVQLRDSNIMVSDMDTIVLSCFRGFWRLSIFSLIMLRDACQITVFPTKIITVRSVQMSLFYDRYRITDTTIFIFIILESYC